MQTRRRYKMRRTRRKRGGKLVGVGKYGCGFKNPSLRCEGNAKFSSNFSKLMLKDEAVKEWGFRDIIASIDPEMKYSIYPAKMCSPHPMNIRLQSPYIKSCTPIMHLAQNATSVYDQLIAKKDQLALLRSPVAETDLFEYIQLLAVPREYKKWPALFESFANLFKGLSLYHAHNFYHMDIKPDNIAMEFNKTYEPTLAKYIDFGLAIKADTEIDPTSLEYLRGFSEMYPLYLFFTSYAPEKRVVFPEDGLAHFINVYYTKINKYKVPYDEYYMGDTPILTPAVLQKQLELMNTMDLRRVLEKVDLFCLGRVLYLCIIHVCSAFPTKEGVQTFSSAAPLYDSKYEKAFMQDFLSGLYPLLRRMTTPLLEETLTAEEATAIYTELLEVLRANM